MSPARPNPYRMSERTIKVLTGVLITILVVAPIAGFIYGATLGSDYQPWQNAIALGLIAGGIGIPILAGAVLGGEAIMRGGGLVGFLFAAGLIGGPTGQVFGIVWLAVAGYVALALGVIGFFVIGFRKKVPIWIGPRGAKLQSWNDPSDPNTTNT